MQKSINFQGDYLDLAQVKTYQAGVLQSTAFRVINKVTTDMLKEHNLSTMQWFIVGTVHDAGDEGISITDLARKLDTGVSFLTNSINVLELKGMVNRKEHAKDSRVRIVRLSPSFKSECLDIETKLRQKMRETLYDHITPEDLRVYIKVLKQLASL
ncbi:MAG: MarR family winged helix-turn-helix transcriptional regulator [Candidatus Saccharimonadales bacterium]